MAFNGKTSISMNNRHGSPSDIPTPKQKMVLLSPHQKQKLPSEQLCSAPPLLNNYDTDAMLQCNDITVHLMINSMRILSLQGSLAHHHAPTQSHINYAQQWTQQDYTELGHINCDTSSLPCFLQTQKTWLQSRIISGTQTYAPLSTFMDTDHNTF